MVAALIIGWFALFGLSPFVHFAAYTTRLTASLLVRPVQQVGTVRPIVVREL